MYCVSNATMKRYKPNFKYVASQNLSHLKNLRYDVFRIFRSLYYITIVNNPLSTAVPINPTTHTIPTLSLLPADLVTKAAFDPVGLTVIIPELISSRQVLIAIPQ